MSFSSKYSLIFLISSVLLSSACGSGGSSDSDDDTPGVTYTQDGDTVLARSAASGANLLALATNESKDAIILLKGGNQNQQEAVVVLDGQARLFVQINSAGLPKLVLQPKMQVDFEISQNFFTDLTFTPDAEASFKQFGVALQRRVDLVTTKDLQSTAADSTERYRLYLLRALDAVESASCTTTGALNTVLWPTVVSRNQKICEHVWLKQLHVLLEDPEQLENLLISPIAVNDCTIGSLDTAGFTVAQSCYEEQVKQAWDFGTPFSPLESED